MVYSEKCRSQLGQGSLATLVLAADRPDDLQWVHQPVDPPQGREPQALALNGLREGTAFDVDRAALPISEKLKILSGHDYRLYAGADMHQPSTGLDLSDDFASDPLITKFCRLVLWHCECLYYQMAGEWIGEWVHSLKQRFSNLPEPVSAEVSYR